jgi:arginyl-tRNA synthetase
VGAVDWSALGVPEEKDLALRCAQYGAVVRKAAAELDTSCLANYLLDLAKSFSRFYRACSVLSAPTPQLCRARIELSAVTRSVLKAGLTALTISTIESM